ncbi:MAG: DNA repair protein RecN [Parachlamydiaceae bacterium]|nr:DNA repair protein RecN [Parachlamydiaceae bacterium]
MLKSLRIQNLVLVETAELPFSSGLNILSGETGSGKSAIMNALGLITGERTDSGMIRHGEDKGSVEAVFDIDSIPRIQAFLDESGIEHEQDCELIIRREILSSGRSRAFINHQNVQLSILKQLSEWLFDIVGQHANQKLLDSDHYRDTIDLFGDVTSEVAQFSKSWTEENQKRHTLEELVRNESQRVRDLERFQNELTELEEAQLKTGEEESLFAEYTLLSSAEELMSKTNDIYQGLSGEKFAALPLLNRLKNTFDQLVRIAPNLADSAKAFESALIELQEVSHTLSHYHSRIEMNPARAEEVNERLTLIDRLKRKYGSTIEDVLSYYQTTKEKVNALENADTEIEKLQADIQILSERNQVLAQALTKKRKQAAAQFEKAIVKELRALNMPKVEFHCELTTQKRSRNGDDHIEFLLQPNVGEQRVAVRNCASGGELSRLMLALQVILAGKKQIPTLVFDEVDANIGGETATIVGEKLKEIGKQHQVLCITHFAQVAKQADLHFQISKNEQEGRTFTSVKVLDAKTRKKELVRMHG